jgi:hypothetical protein
VVKAVMEEVWESYRKGGFRTFAAFYTAFRNAQKADLNKIGEYIVRDEPKFHGNTTPRTQFRKEGEQHVGRKKWMPICQ